MSCGSLVHSSIVNVQETRTLADVVRVGDLDLELDLVGFSKSIVERSRCVVMVPRSERVRFVMSMPMSWSGGL